MSFAIFAAVEKAIWGEYNSSLVDQSKVSLFDYWCCQPEQQDYKVLGFDIQLYDSGIIGIHLLEEYVGPPKFLLTNAEFMADGTVCHWTEWGETDEEAMKNLRQSILDFEMGLKRYIL